MVFVKLAAIFLFQATTTWSSSVIHSTDDRGLGAASLHALLHVEPIAELIKMNRAIPIHDRDESNPKHIFSQMRSLLISASGRGVLGPPYQDQLRNLEFLCRRFLSREITIESLVGILDVATNSTTADGVTLFHSLFRPSSQSSQLSVTYPIRDSETLGSVILINVASFDGGFPPSLPLTISATGRGEHALVATIHLGDDGVYFAEFFFVDSWYTSRGGSISGIPSPTVSGVVRGLYVERRASAGSDTTTTEPTVTTTEILFATEWPIRSSFRPTLLPARDGERPTTDRR